MTEQKKLGAILLNIFIVLSLPLIIKGEEIKRGDTDNQYETKGENTYDQYDEQRIMRELELLPILSLERTRRETGRAGRMYIGFADEVFRGRIIPKVVPKTATLAIDGIGCGISTGNIIGPSSTWGQSFQARWGYEVLNVGCPNDDAGWCDDKDWPAPSACVDANRDYICDCGWGGCVGGCDDINAPDCGYRERLGDMTGEFEGLLQYVAERLKEALVQRDLRILVNKSLCGKGSCVDTPWPLDHLCLTVNQDPTDNANIRERCWAPSKPLDPWVVYYNKTFVEVFPNPGKGTIDVILLLWAEGGVPGDPQGIPVSNRSNGNTNPSSDVCVELRLCGDSSGGGAFYADAIAIKASLYLVVQDNLVDVCVKDTELDIINSHVYLEGCVAGCFCDANPESPPLGNQSLSDEGLEETLGASIAPGIDNFLHGNCPGDRALSLCPKVAFRGWGYRGPCAPSIGCSFDATTGEMSCTCQVCPENNSYGPCPPGSVQCTHGIFPIDLNELLGGRSFSVTQYCGRPQHFAGENAAHLDPLKCWPGHYKAGDPTPPPPFNNPLTWYGTMSCGKGIYDIGCYMSKPPILTGTGCSAQIDAAIRPRDLSQSCSEMSFDGYPASPTFSGTSGFVVRAAFDADNYTPEPLLFPQSVPAAGTNCNIQGDGVDDDNGYCSVSIPFTFNFYFGSYTSMCISTNGFVRFGAAGADCGDATPDPIPYTNTPNAWAGPMWADLSIENEYLYYVSEVVPATWIDAYSCRIMGAMDVGASAGDPLDDTLVGNVNSACAGSNICGVSSLCNDEHSEPSYTTYNDCSYNQSIGWSFPFFGSNFSNVCISSNGIIYFRNDGICPAGALNIPTSPAAGGPNYSIAVVWKDLDPLTMTSDEDCSGCASCSFLCTGHDRHRGEFNGFGSVYKHYISGTCPTSGGSCSALVITWYRVVDFNVQPNNADNCSDNNDSNADCTNYAAGRDWCEVREGSNLYDCGCNPDCGAYGGCNATDDSNCRRICRCCIQGCQDQARAGQPNEWEAYKRQVQNTNTFQVVLWQDGTIDINVKEFTDTAGSCNGTTPPARMFLKQNSSRYIELSIAPNKSYRIFPLGYANTVCGTGRVIYGSGTCTRTTGSGTANCVRVRWENVHVKGQGICITMEARIMQDYTGTGAGAGSNYDIVFFMERFEVPIASLSPEQRKQLARLSDFTRSPGVENAAGDVGAYAYIPPDGNGLVMRWQGPWTYWIGVGISQDLMTDASNMLYSGVMCLSANVGGVNTADTQKYYDIFTTILPFNLSSADSAKTLFPFITNYCDPDGQVELRMKPSGVTQASARTGLQIPSVLIAGSTLDTFPYEGALGISVPQTCTEWGFSRCADVVFSFPNFKAEIWCHKNNLPTFAWIKDGITGPPTYVLGITSDWFIGADIEYAYISTGISMQAKLQDASGGNEYVYVKIADVSCAIASGDILEYWIRVDPATRRCALDAYFSGGGVLRNVPGLTDQNGIPAHPDGNLQTFCPDPNCTKTAPNTSCRCPVQDWYRRRISLSSFAGQTLQELAIGVEEDANGGYSCQIMGIKVLNSSGGVKCSFSGLRDMGIWARGGISSMQRYSYSVAGNTIGDIFIFADVKPNPRQIQSSVLLPSQIIGGIADIFGDILSGWLQGRIRTKFNIPLEINMPLHFVFKKVKPQGPDIQTDETNFNPWLSYGYPPGNIAPDYLVIYIDRFLGNIDVVSLMMGGLSLAPPAPYRRSQVSTSELISFDIPECSGKGEKCVLTPDVAKKYFTNFGPNNVNLRFGGGVIKYSWRKNGSMWKLPNSAAQSTLDIGTLLEGPNIIEIAPILDDGYFYDENPVILAIYMDTQPPYVSLRGGRELETGIMYFSGVPVFVLEYYDMSGEVFWSYKIDDGEWSEWIKGGVDNNGSGTGRIKADVSKGTHVLYLKVKDKWGNETSISKPFYFAKEGVFGCSSLSEVEVQEIVWKGISFAIFFFPVLVVVLMVKRNGKKTVKRKK